MTTSTVASSRSGPFLRRAPFEALIWGAPLATVLAGLSAEWLDFRSLRYPLLIMVLAGVAATAYALFGRRVGARAFALTVLLGACTWGAAETLYVVIHAGSGQSFDAPRFGAQWSQALGLIAVHAGVLGFPTGIVAALLIRLPWLLDRMARRG